MTTFDVLDNPIWESLTSIHANMARSNGSARRYASQVSPLAAVSKPTPTAFSDLAALMKVEEQVGLFTAEPLQVADGWETIRSRPIEQMICTELTWESRSFPLELGCNDVAEMLASPPRLSRGRSWPKPFKWDGISASGPTTDD